MQEIPSEQFISFPDFAFVLVLICFLLILFDIFFFILDFDRKFIEIANKKGMNEDGSFIGQYGRNKRNPDKNAQAFATLV